MNIDESIKLWEIIPYEHQEEILWASFEDCIKESYVHISTEWHSNRPVTKENAFKVELVHGFRKKPLATEDIRELILWRINDDLEEYKESVKTLVSELRSFADELESKLEGRSK